MKRVLIFSLAYVPHIGGAEVAIKEITDRLGDEYSFDMVTLRFDAALPAREQVGNVQVYRIGRGACGSLVSDRALPLSLRFAKTIFPFTALIAALRLHDERPYDAIWAMMANHAGFAALFFKLLRPRVPYILELQDGRVFAEMKQRRSVLNILWPLYLQIYRRADSIKVISSFLEREVRGIGFSGRVEVVPNAVDVAKFSAPVPQERLDALRARFGVREGEKLLFTASRLVLSRGVEETIRALRFLPPHVKLLIAGEGDDREALQSVAREIGVSDRTVFAGHVSHAELPAYYQIADVFVRPSLIEGFGNAFVEAFAAGTPVVATPVGGITDFLFDPERNPGTASTGIFCEVGDPQSVARACARYLDDPKLAAAITKNAKRLVSEKYDWAIIARQMRERVFEPAMR